MVELQRLLLTGRWDLNIEGSTLLDANGWYHVVFTFDDSSNRLRIYVNGSKINQESYSGSTVNQNSEFSIGVGMIPMEDIIMEKLMR